VAPVQRQGEQLRCNDAELLQPYGRPAWP